MKQPITQHAPLHGARDELYEASIALLAAEKILEYAKSQVLLNTERKERLEKFIASVPAQEARGLFGGRSPAALKVEK